MQPESLGIPNYRMMPTLNTAEPFIRALAGLVEQSIVARSSHA